MPAETPQPAARVETESPWSAFVREMGSTAPQGSRPVAAPAPGWRTTEFWLTALLVGGIIAEALSGVLPGGQATTAALVAATTYKVLRTLLKMRVAARQLDAFTAQLDAETEQKSAQLNAETERQALARAGTPEDTAR